MGNGYMYIQCNCTSAMVNFMYLLLLSLCQRELFQPMCFFSVTFQAMFHRCLTWEEQNNTLYCIALVHVV